MCAKVRKFVKKSHRIQDNQGKERQQTGREKREAKMKEIEESEGWTKADSRRSNKIIMHFAKALTSSLTTSSRTYLQLEKESTC